MITIKQQKRIISLIEKNNFYTSVDLCLVNYGHGDGIEKKYVYYVNHHVYFENAEDLIKYLEDESWTSTKQENLKLDNQYFTNI